MLARFTGIAVAVAAGVLAAMPAYAQPGGADAEGDDPIYCVYNALTTEYDFELVAEAFLYDELDDETTAKAVKLVADAADACAKKHSLSDSQKAVVADLGIYGSAADYLTDDLLIFGAPEAAIDGIFAVLDSLSDEEFMKFFDAGWRSNLAFHEKIKSGLISKGMPDDEDMLETAYMIMELSSMTLNAISLFDASEGDGASDKP